MADPHQEYRLTHRIGDVLALDDRLWHPGKPRELIDHPPNIVDLSDDRVGALFKDSLVFGNDLSELAPDPFGRKLNWRQRVLDFGRDTTSDIGPCRSALSGHQFGDVVERDDVAVTGLAGLLCTDSDRQVTFVAVAGNRDLALHQTLRALPRGFHHVIKFRDHFG